jgi:methylated-DNA-protein-cysteine methyltransferase-like protein
VRDRAGSETYRRIYAVVQRIPRGRVATYGQVARLAGIPSGARQVGYALHALPEGSRVPWQRVVNARGEISPRSLPGPESAQRVLLEDEGVELDLRERIDLARFGWRPRLPSGTPSGAHCPHRKGGR